jgi:DNA-binding HxlR family transcriptional regulator
VFGPDGRRVCGIADALGVIGDRWALLTIRELGFGVTRFNDIRANTGAPRASLAARLRELEDAGLVERRRYSSRPPRDEYLLTPAGRELGPVLRELRFWGERHASSRSPSGTG